MKPAIRASEIARYLFCARALTYDWRYPPRRRVWRVLGHPLQWLVLGLVLVGIGLAGGLDVLLVVVASNILLVGAGLGLVGWLNRPPQSLPYRDQLAYRNRRLFVAQNFGLVGRPDYILRQESSALPLLTKRYPVPDGPHQAHTMQVIAHCLLMAEAHSAYPPFGILRYGDGRTFEIDFDEDAVEVLSQIMDDIEALRGPHLADISHDEPGRCYACRHRARCTQRLT